MKVKWFFVYGTLYGHEIKKVYAVLIAKGLMGIYLYLELHLF